MNNDEFLRKFLNNFTVGNYSSSRPQGPYRRFISGRVSQPLGQGYNMPAPDALPVIDERGNLSRTSPSAMPAPPPNTAPDYSIDMTRSSGLAAPAPGWNQAWGRGEYNQINYGSASAINRPIGAYRGQGQAYNIDMMRRANVERFGGNPLASQSQQRQVRHRRTMGMLQPQHQSSMPVQNTIGTLFSQFSQQDLLMQESGDTGFRQQGGQMQMFSKGTGEILAGPGQIQTGIDVAKGAFNQAMMGGGLPSNPEDAMATVFKRINKAIIDTYDKATKQAQGPAEKQAASAVKNTAFKVAQEMKSQSSSALGMQRGNIQEAVTGRNIHFGPQEQDALTDFLRTNPSAAARVNDYGLQRALNSSAGVTFRDGGGGSFTLGGGRGGRGWGGGGRGRGGMWSGNLGGAMYGMYIGQRLWGYTGKPVVQGAQKYAQGLGDYRQLYRSEVGPLQGSLANAGQRQSAIQNLMQRAAFDQLSGFQDVGYAMSQGPGAERAARVTQGAKIGLGGAMVGGVMQSIGGGAMGGTLAGGIMSGIGSALGPIGLTYAGGTAIMEGVNAATGSDLSWGGLLRGAHKRAVYATAGSKLSWRNNFRRGQQNEGGWGGLRASREQILDEMPEEVASLYWGEDRQAEFEEMKDFASSLANVTGGDAAANRKSLRQWGRWLPGGTMANKDWLGESLKSIPSMASEEISSEVMGLLPRAGFMPGDAGIQGFVERYTQAGNAGRAQIRDEIGQYSSVGGMLAPYMGSQREATAFARRHEMDLMGGRNAQTYAGVAGKYGYRMDEVVGYTGEYESRRPVTMGDQLANRAKSVGSYQAGIDASVGDSLIRAGMAPEEAFRMASRYDMTSQAQVQPFANLVNTYEQFGGLPSAGQQRRMLQGLGQQNTFQNQMIAGAAPRMMLGGISDPGSMLSGLGYSNQRMANLTSFISGDLRAGSYMAHQGQMGAGAMMFDRAGNQIFETSGSKFLDFMTGQAGIGNQSALGLMSERGIDPSSSKLEQANALFGLGNRYSQAFLDEGIRGMEEQRAEDQYGNQMARIGLGYQRLGLKRDYYWGEGQGGTWDSPTSGSLWGMQDTKTQLQHQYALAGFAAQEQRMVLQNQYQVQSEGLSERRMNVSQGYQNWQMGFNRQGSMMQQQWTAQDWQYQDQMTQMQLGWTVEDMDEAIRSSSGRQRRKLVEQKERMLTKHNLEGQQTETERSRQEEVWAREEERYGKQMEYNEELQEIEQERFDLRVTQREELWGLDQENFERRKEEYEEMRQLEEKMRKRQRKFQAEQLELQEQSLGIQASAAAQAKEYQDAMQEVLPDMEDVGKEMKNISDYDVEKQMKLVEEMLSTGGDLDPAVLKSQMETYRALSEADKEDSDAVKGFLEVINGTSEAANKLEDMLEEMSSVDTEGVDAMKSLFGNASNIDTKGTWAIYHMLNKINNVDTYRVRTLSSFVNAWY